MGKDANYIVSDGNWDETMKYPGNDKVVKDYRAKYPNVTSIGIPVGCAYGAIQILAKAIETAGSLDREKIRSAKDSRVAILNDGTRLQVSRAGYAKLKSLLEG